MLLFIDESGDPGREIDRGSSKYFIVALLAFENHNDASAVDERIDLLRVEMGLTDHFEFHFNKMKPGQRKQFLSAIAPYKFMYWGIVINKAKLSAQEVHFKQSLHKYACGLVFENAKPRLSNTIVVIDGTVSKDFRQQLKTYLSRRLKDDSGRCLIKKLKVQDSKKNNLLQLADMVVSSLARVYGAKRDSSDYRKLIAHREVQVELWPK